MQRAYLATAFTVAVVTWGPAPAFAQDSSHWMARGVPLKSNHALTESGRAAPVLRYFNVAARCRSAGATMTVETPPAHGAVTIADDDERPFVDGRPFFPVRDRRAACADRLTTSKLVTYTPGAGFSGHDAFTVSIGEAGSTATQAVEVDVVAFGYHASAATADCAWAGVPADIRSGVTGASTFSAAADAMRAWGSSNDLSKRIVRECHAVDTPLHGAVDNAAIALAAKALVAFAQSKFTDGTGLTQAGLDAALAQIAPAERVQLAGEFARGMKGHLPTRLQADVDAYLAAARPTSREAFEAALSYLLGKVVLEALAAA